MKIEIEEVYRKKVPPPFRKWKQYTRYRDDLRLKVYHRDNFTCRYCGLDMKENYEAWILKKIKPHEILISVDHIEPRKSKWHHRVWSLDNLVTACRPCNNEKGGRKLYDDYVPPIKNNEERK